MTIIVVAREADLPYLKAYLPQGGPAKHMERLARQARGEVVYLIAWQEQRPIGHALLKWGGSSDAAVADRLTGVCPDIEDLFVAEDARGQGVGTKLLQEAERLVRERGISRVGLSVGAAPDSPARRLYERLGYRDAGFGPYLERGEYRDAAGGVQRWEEQCLYLIKQLGK